MRMNFCYLKIIHFVNPRYHPKIIGSSKIYTKNKYVCLGYMIKDNENEAEKEK